MKGDSGVFLHFKNSIDEAFKEWPIRYKDGSEITCS